MKRIVTLNTRNLEESKLHGGCGYMEDAENVKHLVNQLVKHLVV